MCKFSKLLFGLGIISCKKKVGYQTKFGENFGQFDMTGIENIKNNGRDYSNLMVRTTISSLISNFGYFSTQKYLENIRLSEMYERKISKFISADSENIQFLYRYVPSCFTYDTYDEIALQDIAGQQEYSINSGSEEENKIDFEGKAIFKF